MTEELRQPLLEDVAGPSDSLGNAGSTGEPPAGPQLPDFEVMLKAIQADPSAVPAEYQAFIPIVTSIEPRHLQTLAQNVQAVQENKPLQLDVEAVGSVLKAYKQAPPEAKAALASKLPPQAQQMMPIVETLPASALVEAAPVLMNVIAKAQGKQEEKGKEQDVEAQNQLPIDPADAAKLLVVYQNLPQETKNALVQAVPEEQRAMAESAMNLVDGMDSSEVEELCKDGLADMLNGGGGSGGGDSKEAQEKQMKMKKKMALFAARSQMRSLAKWVKDSPTSIRALSFLCGLVQFGTAIISIVLSIFSAQFLALIMQVWILIFSLLVVILEIKLPIMETYLPRLFEYAQFLNTVSGRGCFLAFVGLLATSLLNASVEPWVQFLSIGAGFACLLIGLIGICLGQYSSKQLNSMRTQLGSEEAVRKAFAEADADNSGALDLAEVGELCFALGSKMRPSQLEVVMRNLDKDRNGVISIEEFLAWWTVPRASASDATSRGAPVVKVVEAAEFTKKGYSIFRMCNLLAGLGTFVGGIFGVVVAAQAMSNKFELGQFMILILNIWIILGGMVVCSLEMRKFGGNYTQRLVDEYALFLDLVAGRGVFYLFVGSVPIVLYQSGLQYVLLISIFAGLGLMVLGVINVITGKSFNNKLKELRGLLKDNVAEDFAHIDLDGDGQVDLDELQTFCTQNGIDLNHRQWELLKDKLDRDGDGCIRLDEFTQWWTHNLSA